MEARLALPDLDATLRQIVRDEVERALSCRDHEAEGYLDVPAAAAYLSTSPEAIRSMVKRGQLVPHRSATGRLLFSRAQLDQHATAGDSA